MSLVSVTLLWTLIEWIFTIFAFEIADGASVEAVVIVDSVCHLELFDAFMVNAVPGLSGVVLWTEPKPADFVLSGWTDVFVIDDVFEKLLRQLGDSLQTDASKVRYGSGPVTPRMQLTMCLKFLGGDSNHDIKKHMGGLFV